MFKLATTTAAAAAAFALAAPASAALTINQDPDPCTTAAPVCNFDFSGVVSAAGMFSEAGSFTLPDQGALSGVVTSINVGGNGNIDFTRIYLAGPGGPIDFDLETGILDIGTLINSGISGGTFTLNVVGTADGPSSFSGDLTFSAVPEPGTWALMIIGFGAIGFAMRRRKDVTTSVRYA
jgi:hypothetical protein